MQARRMGALGTLLLGACIAAEGGTVRPLPSGTAGAGGGVGGEAGSSTAGAPGAAGGGSGGDGLAGGGAGGRPAVDAGGVVEGGSAEVGAADAGVADGGAETGTIALSSEGDGVREIGPTYKDAPEIVASAAPKGKLVRFVIKAGTSVIYPKAPDRGVAVYVPASYVAGRPAPVLVAQDGDNFYDFVRLVSNTLDNLNAAKKLPPIVAVFANNGGGDAQGSERGKEYDTVSGAYAEWVDRELLPRVEQETKSQLPAQAVTFSRDPEARAALGGSSGGAAAFTMAWMHPDLFRRVIAYSGSFVAQESPINPEHPLGAWNYHEDKDEDDGGIIAKTDPPKPVRAWLECGQNDNGARSNAYPHYDFEFAGRRMALKLARKGYHVHLDHGAGAGHVDARVVRQTLPEAMLWVWRGVRIE